MLKIRKILFYFIITIIIQNIIFWLSIVFIGESFVYPQSKLVPIFSSKEITTFKIKNTIFPYLKSKRTELQLDQPDYDKYLIYHNYSLKKIHELIKYRPESDLFKLLNFLYENNKDYLESTDSEIVYSLYYLIDNNNYIEELKKKSDIIKRVEQIKEQNILITPYGLKTVQNRSILIYKEIILNKLLTP